MLRLQSYTRLLAFMSSPIWIIDMLLIGILCYNELSNDQLGNGFDGGYHGLGYVIAIVLASPFPFVFIYFLPLILYPFKWKKLNYKPQTLKGICSFYLICDGGILLLFSTGAITIGWYTSFLIFFLYFLVAGFVCFFISQHFLLTRKALKTYE